MATAAPRRAFSSPPTQEADALIGAESRQQRSGRTGRLSPDKGTAGLAAGSTFRKLHFVIDCCGRPPRAVVKGGLQLVGEQTMKPALFLFCLAFAGIAACGSDSNTNNNGNGGAGGGAVDAGGGGGAADGGTAAGGSDGGSGASDGGIATAPPASKAGYVDRLEIVSTTDAYGGASFGSAGAY